MTYRWHTRIWVDVRAVDGNGLENHRAMSTVSSNLTLPAKMLKIEKGLKFICDGTCDDCIIRFKCLTSRGVVELTVEDLLKLEEQSRK